MSADQDLRELVSVARGARHGALATLAREPRGWPFASLVAIALDGRGRPLLLLSGLAEHTKNLQVCPHASLLVADERAPLDPLATWRMTLIGECALLPEPERDSARTQFLARHPEAGDYASLGDFTMWRLEVASVRWVGGFARMQWATAAEYTNAQRETERPSRCDPA